jgi:iron complex transport system permease protein
MKRKYIPVSILLPLLGGLVAALILGSFLLGRYPILPSQVVEIMASKLIRLPQTWPSTMETVVLKIRLPRIAAALLVGGALASSGAAYQSLFKNPLISPAILGVSAGAGFGAALAMLLSLPWFGIQVMAFGFGLAAVACTLCIGRIFGTASLTVLVLAGLVVSAFCEALISTAKYVADPLDKLPSITFWLMGGLARVGQHDIGLAAFPICISFLVLYLVRWQVNVLGLGEEGALALGVDIQRIKIVVILATTLMSAAAVSVAGVVGWVGLLIPHIARMLVGPNFQRILPVSMLLGGGYLLLIDDIARGMNVEIPLGILTSIIGAPFFVFVMLQVRRGWA